MEETVNTTVASDQSNNTKISVRTIQPGEKLIRRYLSALNDHNSKRASSYFTDDFVMQEGSRGKIHRGKGRMRSSMTGLFALFPDFDIKIIKIFGTDNDWSLEWAWTGVFANGGPYADDYNYIMIETTQIGFSIFKLKDGKISHETRYEDMKLFLDHFVLQDYYFKPQWLVELGSIKSGGQERIVNDTMENSLDDSE